MFRFCHVKAACVLGIHCVRLQCMFCVFVCDTVKVFVCVAVFGVFVCVCDCSVCVLLICLCLVRE